MQTDLVRRKLLTWFRREKRQLPWRGTRDPYRIWVSEVMLQQTTVGAVRNRYAPFLARFRDVRSLARAREESVLAAWSGLGYYARARNLRRAAQVIEREHRGRLPRESAELEQLPGFGRYMAAAVASLAFGERVPAAEANVTRVLSRLFAIDGIAERRSHRDRVLSLAERLLPRRNPGDLTAALMDLGQTICTPRQPRCPRCPVRRECRARQAEEPERYPERLPKARLVDVAVAAAVATRGAHALLVRSTSRRLSGLWQFPSAEARTLDRARRDLAKMIHPLGWRLTSTPAGHARHTIMNRRMEITVFSARAAHPATANHPSPIGQSRWFLRRELEQAAIPTLTRKIAEAGGFL